MFLSNISLTAVLAVLSAVPVTCHAEDTVTIGGVDVPADCALARKEHPRLLFSKADLPQLRARLEHPRIAAELEHAKQLAAENKAGAILLGVLYYLTEEPKYIEAAKAKLEPSWVQTYPLAADLVMGAMTPAEQQAEADRIVEIVKKERWRPHLVLDLAAWGHGHDDFLNADLNSRFRTDMIEGIEYNNLWSQGRGGSSMSHGYYGEHFYSPWTWPPQVVHVGVNATEVEDNYEKWSEDPRYEAWMTRPEYRNFIDGQQKQREAQTND